MTNEQAIKELQESYDIMRNHDIDESESYLMQALGMAIKALDREPEFLAKSDGTIEQIKDCEDCLFKKEWEKIGKLISVVLEKQTEQEINSDYISREKTLEKFCDYVGSGMSMNDFDALYDIVAKMPSVQPKTGHWIKVSIDKYTESAKYWYRCDKCGEQNLGNTNFCPNCGIKMESEVW